MNPYHLPRNYFKAKSKNKTRLKKNLDWAGVGLLVLAALSFYGVLFPEASGFWGRNITKLFGWIAGVGRYLIPIFIGILGWSLVTNKEKRPAFLKILLTTLLFSTFLVVCCLLGERVWSNSQMGGMVGFLGKTFFVRIFGEVGSWIVAFAGFAVFGLLFVGLTPSDVFHSTMDNLRNDVEEIKKTKQPKVKEKRPPVVPVQPSLAADTKKSDASPKIVAEEKQSAPKLPPKQPVIKEKPAAATPPPMPVANKKTNYASPSLEIFDAADGKQPVSKEELTSRARLLETTLANFNIAAQVVEIHPGPVITRYDLEPAPGVKVSSISSRADDLALAMKSTGIRVLAPIPGKGAVGVEIPNLHPEKVGLQELLGRPEFYNHPSPLAFVLGKTVSGEPCIVDLAASPHMLIAGSTGSGKSVVVHAMISSILYRMPPDRVKFTMIDPKRLELPSYAQTPHLYDPCHSPMQAEVITNAKQAAKVLTRLVKVMEFRYDQFAKANVRNIDSYNQKRKEKNLPPEYYIVVIIDELADLMLTAPKEIEDSVQRLAQMARAVGIHLVLATQRPSVDVITGVIKANLPSRIALRVASAIDSRVIVDTVGAELLLGKGDMLYLPPAKPEPIRVQGAFVSEREVEKLVEHTKQYGIPSYEDLFGSGSALEFAVEDKKEMKDLIEALKLVLERHRVSQDLLKAHFGSSARATNILSLLEVKEFIHKPEGSNRWEINFDMIEDFLGKVNNIPDEEMMA